MASSRYDSVAMTETGLARGFCQNSGAFQARRQADSEAGPGLGDQLRHQG